MNYLEILVAGGAAWIIGALWYSPVLFGKTWQSELGMTEDDLKGANMPLIFGTSFVLMLVMMVGLSFIINMHPPEDLTFTHGLFHGVMAGLFFAATSMGINYLYQRRSIKLYLIDALYQVLFLGLGGAIMAIM